jgi:hypothetical protein
VWRDIKHVFPKRYAQARQVFRCESDYLPWARNGQYLGVPQLSASWRAYFRGYGIHTGPRHPHGQLVAAHLIFRGDGYHWYQWECQPTH